jgi:potassium-transporting ATPase ATP-binding subunit
MKNRNPRRSVRSLFDPAIIVPAIGGSFRKLDPRVLIRNPVMFVVEIPFIGIKLIDLVVGAAHLA